MKMIFHNKVLNTERKNNFVRPVIKPPIMRNPQLSTTISVFAEPMIQRVTNARSGCGACGK